MTKKGFVLPSSVEYFMEKIKCIFCKKKYARYQMNLHIVVVHFDEQSKGGVIKILKIK